MTGLCLVEHSGSRWISPSEHDIKLGALGLLRAIESLLDLADMDDDLYNLSSLQSNVQSWQIRLASIVDFVKAQETGVLLTGNENLAQNALGTFRWTPPHTFRLADTRAGPIALEKFQQELKPGVWHNNLFVSLDKYASTSLGLNQLRLRVSDPFEAKDIVSTHDFCQVIKARTTNWDYSEFLRLFIGDARAGQADIDVPPLLRIRDFRSKAILVGALTAGTKTLYSAAARLRGRVDVTILDETLTNPERSRLVMNDFEDPVLSDEMVFSRSGPKKRERDPY